LYSELQKISALSWFRTDYILSQWEVKLKETTELEIQDQLKPDLVLEAKYNTNSIEPTMSESVSGITDISRPTTAFGLKFSWLFGGDSKTAQLKMVQYEKYSSQIKSERLKIESDFLLSEILRRYEELNKKIKIAEKVSQLQKLKSQGEHSKLLRGRSVTSQVIQTEQEASEAQLTLTQLKVEQLKLLSQFRLFYKGDLAL
jgi:hypothetical protein